MAGDLSEDITVTEDTDQHRFVVFVDGAVAGYSAYRDEPREGAAGPRRIFTHTHVDDDYEGRGVGSALAREALASTAQDGLPVVARCPFIAAYLHRHPDAAQPG